MVNGNKKTPAKLSTRAKVLLALRGKEGEPLSGGKLAEYAGVSRVAVWKGIQALCGAGYPIETHGSGYMLDPQKPCDFLYPWEFGERESLFRYFDHTGSTMDRAREFAARGCAPGTVITAERQSAGKGRNGRSWASRQGGLFCTILDQPGIALADYSLPAMIFQIAVARVLTALCGKPARLRWPNDVYIDRRKIAGLMTELEGEGDMVSWLAAGIGVNVNNTVPSGKAVNCAELAGRAVSRSEVLLRIIDEAERVRRRVSSGTAYSQGNRTLAAEWNSLADGIGAKAAVTDSAGAGAVKSGVETRGRTLAKGIFGGIDPAGRCIIKTEKGSLYFNPGPVSMMFV
ncbi:MAG: biotin--[acetyl-CoA-carboxylase] ligase [Treponema sp.]|jgi:BirA family biotin operon repressor/biotin-[acetyl-CoA-carboxylase] ligase|nr:biotin--[acetyl-CoA-carboxylase] ligase [Treponema sp.]